jgi:hypothetical protein
VLDRASGILPFLYHFCFFRVVKFQGIWPQPIHPPVANRQAKVIKDDQKRPKLNFSPSERVPNTSFRPDLTRPAATLSRPQAQAGEG